MVSLNKLRPKKKKRKAMNVILKRSLIVLPMYLMKAKNKPLGLICLTTPLLPKLFLMSRKRVS